jgi:hypothetical protein
MQFSQNPPPGLAADPATTRSLSVNCPTDTKTVATRLRARVRTFDSRNRPECLRDALRVVDDQGADAAWTADVTGPGVTLVAPGSTNVGDRLMFDTEMLSLDLRGNTAVNWINVASPGAVNSPLEVPVVTRVIRGKGPLTAKVASKSQRTAWKNLSAGTVGQATFSVANTSRGPLTFRLGPAAGGPFSFADPSVVGLHTLAKGEILTFILIYAPPPAAVGQTKGRHTGTVDLLVCNKTKPTKVKLAGSWIAP